MTDVLFFIAGLTVGLTFGAGLIFYRHKFENQLKDAVGQKFELMAQKIFDEKTSRFQDLSTKNLAQILDPLKERIKDFEKKVDETYANERSERGLLRGELCKMMELNQVMSLETQNLTKALKGENKTQGNWGEMILENILERSGLRKGEEFFIGTIKEIPAVISQGNSIEEAKQNVRDALELYLEDMQSEEDNFTKVLEEDLIIG